MPNSLHFSRSLVTVIGGVSEWTGKISSYLILITTAATVIEVVARYVFNSPTDWSYEVEIFTCGAMYVLVGAYCSLHKSHVCVDVLSQRFSKRTNRMISMVVTFPLILILVGTLTYVGVEFAWSAIQLNERTYTSWAPILWPLKITLPVGCFILVFQAIADFLTALYDLGGISK
jgi:TRAP-type mannitol/chloroaromatic compound transport system permease small subunit